MGQLPYDVSVMGNLYPRCLQDGMDIPAWFAEWDGYSCEVWTGQIFVRVSHDGKVFPARCTGWDVSASFPH